MQHRAQWLGRYSRDALHAMFHEEYSDIACGSKEHTAFCIGGGFSTATSPIWTTAAPTGLPPAAAAPFGSAICKKACATKEGVSAAVDSGGDKSDCQNGRHEALETPRQIFVAAAHTYSAQQDLKGAGELHTPCGPHCRPRGRACASTRVAVGFYLKMA